MKKICKVLLAGCFVLIILFLSAYLFLSFYYRQRFSPNTWINRSFSTGKTVQEVNSELLANVKAPIVMITDLNGQVYEINLENAGYQMDYSSALYHIMDKQQPILWLKHLLKGNTYAVSPAIDYDKQQLNELFHKLLPIRQQTQKTPDYWIQWSDAEKQYVLIDNLSNFFEVEEVYLDILEAIDSGLMTVKISLSDYCHDYPLNNSQKEQSKLWKKLQEFQSCSLVYDMGTEKLPLTADIVAAFLKAEDGLPILDENGGLVLDKEAVESFVDALSQAYDTFGKDRQFTTSKKDVITVKAGNYGTTLNKQAEVTYLMENLLLPKLHGNEAVEHIPAYEREGFIRGKDDIGGTYVEVNITAQKLYYYCDYELVIETDIVTGDMKRKWNTPEGVFYVNNKQRNRTLKGPGYTAFVKYWVPVYKGIGIHDASWRKEFGGEIYLKDGSHGCINTPCDIMAQFYEMVEIGTPVIMFYEET